MARNVKENVSAKMAQFAIVSMVAAHVQKNGKGLIAIKVIAWILSQIFCTHFFSVNLTDCVFLDNAEGFKSSSSKSFGTVAIWHIVVSIVSGVVVCIFIFYFVRRSRRRRFKKRKRDVKPQKTDDSIYQDLDLTKMNTGDNYESLQGNAGRVSNVPDDIYQNTDVRKMNNEDNQSKSKIRFTLHTSTFHASNLLSITPVFKITRPGQKYPELL